MTDLLPCPVCAERTFETRMERLDIPYFGEIIQLAYTCSSCGFRRADFHVVNEKEPVRYTLRVESEEDLSVRVVRSGSGHFEVPELGVRADPSEAADAFVSNIEGVLDRCEQAIMTARNGAETDAQRDQADRLLDKCDRLRALEEPWTVLIEDALGNSAIVSDKADRQALTEEEAQELGHPYMVVDLEDMREGGHLDIEP